jgi:hypothetical protein
VTKAIKDMVRTWAPDDFCAIAQPLIPVPPVRPQGGDCQFSQISNTTDDIAVD